MRVAGPRVAARVQKCHGIARRRFTFEASARTKSRFRSRPQRIDRHVAWIFDIAVAHAERLLRRFDTEVDVFRADRTGAPRPQLVENTEDQQ